MDFGYFVTGIAVNPLIQFIFGVFIVSAILIIGYTMNFYYLAFLSSQRKGKYGQVELGFPSITIQLPIYNEKYVAARLVDAICAMEYPKKQMRIMILDDSDDDTVVLLARLTAKYQKRGFRIEHIRRGTRTGYKAGALRYAMKSTDTDFVAIFDADFIPPPWFLKRAIPHFAKPKIGMVQCRWGHVNEDYSAITKAQALSLDFHFLIEQKAKSNSRLFMNFNGTAGIWRRECIEDAGGWHTATLVEDLDLSYRAQMNGWKCLFLSDMVVDAELPVQMNAAKRQQFRWAKGSIQCAVKLLLDVLVQRRIAAEAKIQAFVQLTRHIVYPLMLSQFLALPMLLASGMNLYLVSFLPMLTIAAYLAMGPGAYLMIMRQMYNSSWKSKAKILPSLLVYNAGLSVNNTIAVFDAILGKKNEFLRTPKYGIVRKKDDWRDKAYNLPFTKTALLEIFFGIYGLLGIMISIFSNNAVFAPILGIQTVGFFYVSYLSLDHSRFQRNKSSSGGNRTGETKTASVMYRTAVGSIVAIIALGGMMSFVGYTDSIYPLDQIRGHLQGISATSDHETLREHVALIHVHLDEIWDNLPESKNPVWIFPTEATDFDRIRDNVAQMEEQLDVVSTVPRDSAAYSTGMTDIKLNAITLYRNIMDATPYMYASISNILFSTIWVAAIIGIFAVMKRKRRQLQEGD